MSGPEELKSGSADPSTRPNEPADPPLPRGPDHYFRHPAVQSAYLLASISRGRFGLTLVAGALLLAAMVVEIAWGWLLPRLLPRLSVELPIVVLYVILWRKVLKRQRLIAAEATMMWTFRREAGEKHIRKSTHQEALHILEERARTGAPFALFLRNFDMEAWWRLTPKGTGDLGADQNILTSLSGPGGVERLLAQSFRDRIPVFAISNPNDLTTNTLLPRLVLPNQGWKEVLQSLVKAAAFIVMHAESPTPGVLEELRMIRGAGRQKDTVLILPGAESRKDRRNDGEIVRIIGGVAPARAEFLEKDNPALSSFERILSDDVIDYENPAALPIFADLLASVAASQATLEHERGAALLGAGRAEEARVMFGKCLEHSRQAGMKAGEAGALFNMAKVDLGAGRAAEALEGFEHSAALSKELGDRTTQAIAINYCGRALRDLKKTDDAIARFNEAAELQREAGLADEYIGSLSHIAVIYLDSERYSESEPHCRRVVEESEKAGYQRGIARGWEGLGLGYCGRQDWPKAVQAFMNAVEAARRAGDRELEVNSAIILAGLLSRTTDHARAAEASGIAAEALEALGRREEARSYRHARVTQLYNAGVALLDGAPKDPHPAIALFRQSLLSAREEGLAELEESCLIRIGTAHEKAGEISESIAAYEESIAASAFTHNSERAAQSESNLGALYIRAGRAGEAIVRLQRALEFQRENGTPRDRAYTLSTLAVAYKKTRNVDLALDCEHQLCHLYRVTGEQALELDVLTRIIDSLFKEERYDSLIAPLGEAARLAGITGQVELAASFQGLAGKCHEKRGDRSAALAAYRAALEIARGRGFGELEAQLERRLAACDEAGSRPA